MSEPIMHTPKYYCYTIISSFAGGITHNDAYTYYTVSHRYNYRDKHLSHPPLPD
jgi:hypothetical protein